MRASSREPSRDDEGHLLRGAVGAGEHGGVRLLTPLLEPALTTHNGGDTETPPQQQHSGGWTRRRGRGSSSGWYLVFSPQRRLVDEDAARLSVAVDEARAVVAVARVDGVVGRLSVAHDPRHSDVERRGHVPVPLHVRVGCAVQLVLDLRQDDGAAAVREVAARLCDDAAEPALHRVHPRLVVRAHAHALAVAQEAGDAPVVPLCAHVRPDAQVSEQPRLCDGVEEQGQVAPARPVELALHHLVVVPKHVDLDHVHAIGGGCPHQRWPHARGAAGVVDGAGHEHHRLVVEADGAPVVRHGVGTTRVLREGGKGGGSGLRERQQRQDSRGHQQGEQGSSRLEGTHGGRGIERCRTGRRRW